MMGLLLTLIAHTFLPGTFHEAVGLGFLATVGWHLRLSLRKSRGAGRAPYSWTRASQRLIEILLAANILLLAATGLSLARHLFVLAYSPFRPSLARPLHRILAHTGFLLVGVHIGLRLPSFLALVGVRRQRSATPRFLRFAGYLACSLAVAFGLAAAVRRGYFLFDLSSNLMRFSDPEEPVAAFLVDHAAILSMSIIIGVSSRRSIRGIESRLPKKG